MPSLPLFPATIAGSLPKPAWLAEPEKLWAPWRQQGAELVAAKQDAALVWLKIQEDAGIDIVSEGEQFRIHFVHGFLEHIGGIDWAKKTKMGIRNNRYTVEVPTVTAKLTRPAPDPRRRGAVLARAHEEPAQVHAARADDDLRYDRGCALRPARRHGDGVCGIAQCGSAGAAGAGRRRDPVRRAGLQRVHGRREGRGALRRWSARHRG